MPHRDRIKKELGQEDPLQMDLIRSKTYKAKLGEETEMEKEFRKLNLTRKSSFLPLTFEGMMESFGINLQRKTLYEKFYKAHQQIEVLMKRKDVNPVEMMNIVKESGELMKNIMQISIADPSSLKNEHNTLFLSLMDRIKYLKEMEYDRMEREA